MSATAFQRKRREAEARAAREAAEASGPKPLEKMNKAELTALAAELQLELEGTNAELRERIKAAQKAAEATGGEGGEGGGADGDQS